MSDQQPPQPPVPPTPPPAGGAASAPQAAATGASASNGHQASLELVGRIQSELRKVFVGQEDLVEGLLIGVIGNGHVLIESNPGLGKTLLVKGLSRILGLDTGRIQFTPDLMPADITGSHVFNLAERKFEFRQGPIFTQFLLADEINRSPAKTHAALLEAMQEYQVTADGSRYPITPPFLVVATQNPVENEGTYQLPEAALDRFLLKLVMDYPAAADEEAIVNLHLAGSSPGEILLRDVRPVADVAAVTALQASAASIRVDPSIVSYLTTLVRATRSHPAVFLGASPRACIGLLTGARSLALLRGRNFVVPDDIADVAPLVLRHRLLLTPEAEIEQRTADEVIADVIRQTDVPRS